jgi:hypothetical protein
MEEWVAAWEKLFNLGAGEVARIGRHEVVNYSYNWRHLELCFGWRGRREQLTHSFKALIPEFRRKYYLHNSARVTDEVTVAVHIRRGDVSAPNHPYFTSTEVILKTVAAVKSILDTHTIRYSIRIYSQGNIADFAELSPLGVEFFLDADPIWTMQELIEADVLIMANGFFSYYAALISDGIRIFQSQAIPSGTRQPGWEVMRTCPMDEWLPRQADGSIDLAAFERQLFLLMEAKTAQRTHL